jgi:hypothetical protein
MRLATVTAVIASTAIAFATPTPRRGSTAQKFVNHRRAEISCRGRSFANRRALNKHAP